MVRGIFFRYFVTNFEEGQGLRLSRGGGGCPCFVSLSPVHLCRPFVPADNRRNTAKNRAFVHLCTGFAVCRSSRWACVLWSVGLSVCLRTLSRWGQRAKILHNLLRVARWQKNRPSVWAVCLFICVCWCVLLWVFISPSIETEHGKRCGLFAKYPYFFYGVVGFHPSCGWACNIPKVCTVLGFGACLAPIYGYLFHFVCLLWVVVSPVVRWCRGLGTNCLRFQSSNLWPSSILRKRNDNLPI